MNEYVEGTLGTLAILSALVYSTVWWIGGRPNGRVWRRWIAPLFFGVAVNVLAYFGGTWHWAMLVYPPLLKAVSHIGYGGSTFAVKFARRSVWSFLYICCSLPLAIVTGEWLLFSVQALFCLLASNVFGILNPFKSSPQEEGTIVFSSSFLIPFMVV